MLRPAAAVMPKPPTRDEMQQAQAFVDPSRLIANWQAWPYNPSWLATRKGLAIFDLMKRDEQVKAALKFKKDSVLAAGWEVVSPGGQPEDWEVTRFVRDNLTNIQGGFHRCLLHMLSALDYGYSCAERLYGQQDSGEWQDKLMLKQLSSIRPNFLDFSVDTYGTLQAVIQRPGIGVPMTNIIPPGKVVVYTHNFEYGNYYGTSDLEAAYRPWWTKDNAYKWLAVTLERFGMPPLFALYDPNVYGAAMVDELKKVVKNIQNATLGVIPRATKDALELWSQQLGRESTQIFLTALDRFDHHISRALLVPDLIGMGGSSGSGGRGGGGGGAMGSLARSQQHSESFDKVIESLQDDLSDTAINAQLIPQLCDLNYPGLTAYPLFRFLPMTEEDSAKLLTVWAAMVMGGVVGRIEDDETHIRKMLNFPENDNPTLQPLIQKGASPGGTLPGAGEKLPGTEGGTAEDIGVPDNKTGSETPPEELSQEERLFAETVGGHWVTVNGGHVFIKDKPALLQRIHNALFSYKPATAAKQQYAVKQEQRVAKMLGAVQLDDNEPMDIHGTTAAGKRYGVEVKTFVDNSNDKVTMHPDSLKRKVSWARREKASLHTVVVDARDLFGVTGYSGQHIWYRRGVGSFRLRAMVPVRDAAHLQALVSGEAKYEEELADFHQYEHMVDEDE